MRESEHIKDRLQILIWPELAAIAPHHRLRALERARAEPLDMVETVGVLAGVLIATLLTQYGLGHMEFGDRVFAGFANFAVAVPLMAVLAGPFLVRRIRRGLRNFLARQVSFDSTT